MTIINPRTKAANDNRMIKVMIDPMKKRVKLFIRKTNVLFQKLCNNFLKINIFHEFVIYIYII